MECGNKRNEMIRKRVVLALVTVLAVSAAQGVAMAEYPPLTFGRIFNVAPEDLPIVRETAAPLFDAAATAGATREWSNPQTGHSGAVKLRRMFKLKGMPCRTFDYTTWTEHHASETRVVVDWCQLENDGWKMVDPRDGRPD